MNTAELILINIDGSKKSIGSVNIGNNSPTVGNFIVYKGNTYKVTEVTFNYDVRRIFILVVKVN